MKHGPEADVTCAIHVPGAENSPVTIFVKTVLEENILALTIKAALSVNMAVYVKGIPMK